MVFGHAVNIRMMGQEHGFLQSLKEVLLLCFRQCLHQRQNDLGRTAVHHSLQNVQQAGKDDLRNFLHQRHQFTGKLHHRFSVRFCPIFLRDAAQRLPCLCQTVQTLRVNQPQHRAVKLLILHPSAVKQLCQRIFQTFLSGGFLFGFPIAPHRLLHTVHHPLQVAAPHRLRQSKIRFADPMGVAIAFRHGQKLLQTVDLPSVGNGAVRSLQEHFAASGDGIKPLLPPLTKLPGNRSVFIGKQQIHSGIQIGQHLFILPTAPVQLQLGIVQLRRRYKAVCLFVNFNQCKPCLGKGGFVADFFCQLHGLQQIFLRQLVAVQFHGIHTQISHQGHPCIRKFQSIREGLQSGFAYLQCLRILSLIGQNIAPGYRYAGKCPGIPHSSPALLLPRQLLQRTVWLTQPIQTMRPNILHIQVLPGIALPKGKPCHGFRRSQSLLIPAQTMEGIHPIRQSTVHLPHTAGTQGFQIIFIGSFQQLPMQPKGKLCLCFEHQHPTPLRSRCCHILLQHLRYPVQKLSGLSSTVQLQKLLINLIELPACPPQIQPKLPYGVAPQNRFPLLPDGIQIQIRHKAAQFLLKLGFIRVLLQQFQNSSGNVGIRVQQQPHPRHPNASPVQIRQCRQHPLLRQSRKQPFPMFSLGEVVQHRSGIYRREMLSRVLIYLQQHIGTEQNVESFEFLWGQQTVCEFSQLLLPQSPVVASHNAKLLKHTSDLCPAHGGDAGHSRSQTVTSRLVQTHPCTPKQT